MTACAEGIFSPGCPPLFEYTKVEQLQAEEELTELKARPGGSVIDSRMMPEYREVRTWTRACKAGEH